MVLYWSGRKGRIQRLAAERDTAGLRKLLLAASNKTDHADSVSLAADALAGLGDEGATALVAAVRDDPYRASHGWWEDSTFRKLDRPYAIDLLAGVLLGDPGPEIRWAACIILRKIGNPRAVPAYAVALRDRDAHVRCSAALGLADHGDRRAVEPLLDWILNGDNPYLGVKGLGQTGDPAVIPFLRQMRQATRDWNLSGAIDRAVN